MGVPLESTGIFTETETVKSSASSPGETTSFTTVGAVATPMTTLAVMVPSSGFVSLPSSSILITTEPSIAVLPTTCLTRPTPFRVYTADVSKLFSFLVGRLDTLLRSVG